MRPVSEIRRTHAPNRLFSITPVFVVFRINSRDCLFLTPDNFQAKHQSGNRLTNYVNIDIIPTNTCSNLRGCRVGTGASSGYPEERDVALDESPPLESCYRPLSRIPDRAGHPFGDRARCHATNERRDLRRDDRRDHRAGCGCAANRGTGGSSTTSRATGRAASRST